MCICSRHESNCIIVTQENHTVVLNISYNTGLTCLSFICNIMCIMKNKEKSAMISCIMVSLTGLHTKLLSALYDCRQHSFVLTNIIYAQESVTNKLNFMVTCFTCEIFGSQYSIKILFTWDTVPCHLLHTKLFGIKPKMTNFMVSIMCMFLQSI
jgi:hypothetical protein